MPRSSAREGLLPVGRLAERQRAGSAASSILTDAADGGPVEPAPADTPAVLLQKMRELAWAGGPVQVVADATGGDFRPEHALANSVILLTGATGYLGSLMLELILRTCPAVTQVRCTIRPKSGQTGLARLQALWEGPVFRQLDPMLRHKVEVLEADLTAHDCGLTAEQRDRIDYIIHCAASIRFDLPIQAALEQNFTPTERLVDLAAGMPRLQCFTYMSTAFVNANQPNGTLLEERLYDLYDLGGGLDTDGAMATRLRTMDAKEANQQAGDIMRRNRIANTYFLSKSLTERMLMHKPLAREGRLCIVRPSIVGAVAFEPCPGYIGNCSGFTALILGAASGVIQFTSHRPESVMPLVPGDLVANITLAATISTSKVSRHYRAQHGVGPIVHACTSTTNPLGTRRVHSALSAYFNEDRPVENTLVPDHRSYKCRWLKSDAAFTWACIKLGLRIQLAAAALRINGNVRASRKLKLGWQTWKQLGSSRFDVNLTFASEAARELKRLPGVGELNLVWDEAEGHSWLRYIRTYAAGVRHLYRRELPGTHDQQDFRVS